LSPMSHAITGANQHAGGILQPRLPYALLSFALSSL